MECGVCYHEFDTVIPRLLSCGHTFCEICMETLTRNNRIECPSCRHVHLFDKDHDFKSLKRNYALEEVLSMGIDNLDHKKSLTQIPLLRGISGTNQNPQESKDTNEEANLVLCENCLKKNATVICPGCGNLNFCKECEDKVHSALPQVLLKKNQNAHKTLPLTRNIKFCSEHKLHSYKYFCEEEQTLICSECIRIGGHSRHTFSLLKGAANRYRLVLEQTGILFVSIF